MSYWYTYSLPVEVRVESRVDSTHVYTFLGTCTGGSLLFFVVPIGQGRDMEEFRISSIRDTRKQGGLNEKGRGEIGEIGEMLMRQ